MSDAPNPAGKLAIDPGPRPELTWLPVALLSVEPQYQRTLDSRRSQASIERIVAHFRWSKFGVVIVAEKDAAWVVIDGQHRVEAARRCRLSTVPCMVVPAASIAERAEIFLATNQTRVAVNSYALYWARVAAGEVRAMRTHALCRAAGLSIPRYPIPIANLKPGQTLAVAFLENMANGALDKIGLRAMSIVGRAYAAQPGGASTLILRAAFTALCQEPRGDDRIEAYLRSHPAQGVLMRFVGNAGVTALADAMLRPAAAIAGPSVSRDRLMAGRA